jgi:RNA methyltransferase, TrmH family
MAIISSNQNPKIRLVRSLMGRRKEREEAQAFVIEGVRLLEEAYQAGWQPKFILYSDVLSQRGQETLDAYAAQDCDIEQTVPHLLESIAGTETTQGVLAVFSLPTPVLPEQLDFLVVADGLRDPGNLGTLLRTATAAGVQVFLTTPGTADPFAPKVVRAGMGAHFRVPIISMDWRDIGELVEKRRLALYLADAEGGLPPWRLDLRKPAGLIAGSEAEGASSEARRRSAGIVSIPMPGRSESLNAAMAAGIILFEFVRQRNA